jgi:hypothetical protein
VSSNYTKYLEIPLRATWRAIRVRRPMRRALTKTVTKS